MTRAASLVAPISLVLAVCLFANPSSAQSWCEHLHGLRIGVGEGRVRLEDDGTIVQYANAYHDSGNELSLDASYPVGWLDTGEAFILTVSAYLEDRDTDNYIEFEVIVSVYTKSGACGPGTFLRSDKYKVKTRFIDMSCVPPESCLFHGGTLLETNIYASDGDIYYEIEAGSNGGTYVADSGCLNVGSSPTLCL